MLVFLSCPPLDFCSKELQSFYRKRCKVRLVAVKGAAEDWEIGSFSPTLGT